MTIVSRINPRKNKHKISRVVCRGIIYDIPQDLDLLLNHLHIEEDLGQLLTLLRKNKKAIDL